MDQVVARMADGIGAFGASEWDACAGDDNPFVSHAFLSALEDSGSAIAHTGWQPVPIAIDGPDGAAAAILPAYAKNHSQGEYVFDHGWADAFARAGGSYYPKLQASVPFTPVTGKRFLVAEGGDETVIRKALMGAAATAAEEMEASSVHITFLTEDEWQAAGAFGYLQRTDQQFHWENRGYENFDQFLGELSSSKRKNLRKERASVREAGIEFDWLTGTDITEAHWDRFFAFYMDTGGRKWGRPYLTRKFFSLLGQSMGEQVLLILARRDGRYIAGALNLFGGEVIFGRNWGSLEYVPFLHFETCYYQAIDFAIARGLKRVEAGAQGEHKLLRGYMPVPTYSAHHIVHPGLRRAVSEYLVREREAVAEQIEQLAEYGPFRKSS